MSNKLRNIIQSSQEREVIKTAPDMVVYIEGLPFMENPFLKERDKDTVYVNFNDYITTISTNYTIDGLIPTGSISMSVPNGFKHLFLAPGGNTIFQVMSSIRIYAKCYFYSSSGNTVFRRIFNGLIKSVDLNETQTSLEISIQIAGICRLIEQIQMDMSSALQTRGSQPVTILKTNQGNLSVYDAIYDTFNRTLDFSEFIRYSFNEDRNQAAVGKGNPEQEALKEQYVVKWTQRLNDLKKEVRIFGAKEFKEIKEPITDKDKSRGVEKTGDPQKTGKPNEPLKRPSVSQAESEKLMELLKNYHFDMSIGSVELFGAQLTPRIERLRLLTDIAGFECYQDIDGLIIVKPPLYNLDCTIMGEDSFGTTTITGPNSATVDITSLSSDLSDENLYEGANPYIIHMAEILSEHYAEDEGAIRKTSIVLTPNFGNASGIQLSVPVPINDTIRYTDINLVRQFGVREEPPKYMGFLEKDTLMNYGFAICELNKANRAYRTYQVTIPLRPELRLGFPIYLPHKDMYGYVVSAAISYTVGGQATMSLTCNYIRKRPLMPQKQTITKDGVSSEVLLYVSQPNLVHAWTSAPTGATSGNSGAGNEKLKLENTVSTLPSAPKDAPSTAQRAIIDYRRKKLGDLFETWVESSTGSCWRIQKDDANLKLEKVKAGPVKDGGPPWFDGEYDEKAGKKTVIKKADGKYIQRLSMIQPYTDEKGYEVIPGMPWGRYSTLKQAIVDCTRNYWYKGTTEVREEIQQHLKEANAFLMAGFAIPSSNAKAMQKALDQAKEQSYAAAADASAFAVPDSYLTDTQKQEASAQSASDRENARSSANDKALDLFEKFDKGNVISFELNYENASDYGKTEQDFGASAAANNTPNYSISGYNPSNEDLPEAPSGNFVDKINVFLMGFLNTPNSNNVGPYAVSLLPQNTDIGGYRPPSGPFSGLLSGISATFASSPYGDIFGLRPTQNKSGSYFTSGYESRRNYD